MQSLISKEINWIMYEGDLRPLKKCKLNIWEHVFDYCYEYDLGDDTVNNITKGNNIESKHKEISSCENKSKNNQEHNNTNIVCNNCKKGFIYSNHKLNTYYYIPGFCDISCFINYENYVFRLFLIAKYKNRENKLCFIGLLPTEIFALIMKYVNNQFNSLQLNSIQLLVD